MDLVNKSVTVDITSVPSSLNWLSSNNLGDFYILLIKLLYFLIRWLVTCHGIRFIVIVSSFIIFLDPIPFISVFFSIVFLFPHFRFRLMLHIITFLRGFMCIVLFIHF